MMTRTEDYGWIFVALTFRVGRRVNPSGWMAMLQTPLFSFQAQRNFDAFLSGHKDGWETGWRFCFWPRLHWISEGDFIYRWHWERFWNFRRRMETTDRVSEILNEVY